MLKNRSVADKILADFVFRVTCIARGLAVTVHIFTSSLFKGQ